MSENNFTENKCKDNGVFDSLCVATSAGIDDKLFMATAIDSIGHRSIDANKVQPSQLTNESKKNIKHNINCLSTTMTTLIDHEKKLTENNNSTCIEEKVGKVANKLAVHNELIAVQVQDQSKTVIPNKKKCRDNELDARLKSDPICGLQELCRYRDWKLPEYKYFKEGDSTTFTYSVECTVLSFTVRVEGLLKKEAKRKAATLMYQKIKMSENNFTENKCKDNGVFDSLCVATSAGIDDKLFMATAINSIGQRSIDVNKVQPPQLTNESKKNLKHNINCLSTTMTTLIDHKKKLTGNNNSTCIEENVGKVANKLAVHNELIAVQVQDQTKTVITNKKKFTDNELDAHLKSDPICARQEFCNDIVRHPASLEKPDTGRPIVYSGFPYDNENHVSPVNGSVIVNENQQSMFASVDVDFAKHFRRSNKPSVLELKEMKVISMLTVPSNVDLLKRIADEEELILHYDIDETCSPMIRKDLMCVQLTVNHSALTVVGFGETLLDCQEDAAYECLTHLKSVLKN
ncbi:uncharacterized protein LOC112684530 [Sipha flava]|uniref:Uncharacterized protein LOC112684530 n=1 Tax=Sipha flava TaxID=143950 RepID=A0A8B8FMJ0_9HEMI|nr:uncharacterized protein LOC112684530 [Sipha flava]